MRLAVLYARSRGMPMAVVGALALCGLGAWAGQWLAARPDLDDTTARVPVVVALAVAVAVAIASTLYSCADEVERTTPRRWAIWRGVHASGGAVLGLTLLAPVLPAATYGQTSLLRNLAGLLGLALLAATVVGPRLAWALPLGYAATVYLSAGGLRTDDGRAVWAFVLQEQGSFTASATALTLLTVGVLTWSAVARRPMR